MMEWLTHQHDHGATLVCMIPAHGVFITPLPGQRVLWAGALDGCELVSEFRLACCLQDSDLYIEQPCK